MSPRRQTQPASAPSIPPQFNLTFGIGPQTANLFIQPDGAPAGEISLEYYSNPVSEHWVAEFWLYRNYYYDGKVCVDLEAESGTAIAGEDFDADATTYCWEDQDQEPKYVTIDIVDDETREASERFRAALSNATGGAVIGPRNSATITIASNDAPIPEPARGGGGGGSTGLLALVLLGRAELLRAAHGHFRKQE
jgi:hypothetical protein